MAEDRRVFGITGDWSTALLDPGFGTAVQHGMRRVVCDRVGEGRENGVRKPMEEERET